MMECFMSVSAKMEQRPQETILMALSHVLVGEPLFLKWRYVCLYIYYTFYSCPFSHL